MKEEGMRLPGSARPRNYEKREGAFAAGPDL